MAAERIIIQIVPATAPRNMERIKHYTQLRREEFGRFLFQEAQKIRAERAAKTKGEQNT